METQAVPAGDGDFRQKLLELLDKDEEVRKKVHALVLESEVLKELKAFRDDANKRFEAGQQELKAFRDDANKRFEAADKRFEEIQQEIRLLREESNKRFEAADKRFEAVLQEIKQLREDTHKHITTLGRRWGIQTEEAVRAFAQEFIASEFSMQAERWRHGKAELDVVVKDGIHVVIEVKSMTYEEDVKKFCRNLSLYKKKTGFEPTRKIIVTAHANSRAYKKAQQEGIEIISG